MGKLVTVGFKLAVLGVAPNDIGGNWHIVKPGSYNVPQFGPDDGGKTMARSICGRWVISNGYAADFVPADHEQCPACWEQL